MSKDPEKQKAKKEKLLDKALQEEMGIDKEKLKSLKKKLAKVEAYPERGIETWFRLASKNIYTRRQIVDTKSNILVTINSIIISVILGSLYTKLDDDPHLIYGIVPMVITNLLSIGFAIIATRPALKKGVFTKEQVANKSASLMTFDDFYKMPEEEYEWAVGELVQDREFLYSSIKKDIYYLGTDLSKRYKAIQTSYNIFLGGLIISLFFFGGCHLFF